MRNTALLFLFLPALFQVQAASFFSTLHKGNSSSAYDRVRTYFFNRGLSVSPHFAEPRNFKVVHELTVHNTGGENPSGSPKWIRLVDDRSKNYYMDIREGETGGWTHQQRDGVRIRVELLDAEENPTDGAPVYFHITGFDGTQYRVHATKNADHCYAEPIFVITPGGDKHEFKDSGYEILVDEAGDIVQIRSTTQLLNVQYPEPNVRVEEKFSLNQVHKEKINGLYIPRDEEIPKEKNILSYPESEEFRHMKLQEWKGNNLSRETVWYEGKDPFYYKMTSTVPGQEKPTNEKHYFYGKDGEFFSTTERYRDGGDYQYSSKFLSHNRKWYTVYERKLRNGSEWKKEYTHIEDFESNKLIELQTLEQPVEGKWFRKNYDENGRLIMEWTPVEEEVKEDVGDPGLKELLTLFPDASEESMKKHRKFLLLPERAPEDITLADTQGQKTVYSYEPHFAEDVLTADDPRPRTVSRWKQGEFQKREWFVYGSREDGTRYELQEWTTNPEAPFGSEENKRINKEFHAENHPVAPGKLQSIAHEDGSMEYFYYSKGIFDQKTGVFKENGDDGDLRTISTHGNLMDGNWVEGTRSITTIWIGKGKVLQVSDQKLNSDGIWESL